MNQLMLEVAVVGQIDAVAKSEGSPFGEPLQEPSLFADFNPVDVDTLREAEYFQADIQLFSFQISQISTPASTNIPRIKSAKTVSVAISSNTYRSLERLNFFLSLYLIFCFF